jgi:hypothetical protein
LIKISSLWNKHIEESQHSCWPVKKIKNFIQILHFSPVPFMKYNTKHKFLNWKDIFPIPFIEQKRLKLAKL